MAKSHHLHAIDRPRRDGEQRKSREQRIERQRRDDHRCGKRQRRDRGRRHRRAGERDTNRRRPPHAAIEPHRHHGARSAERPTSNRPNDMRRKTRYFAAFFASIIQVDTTVSGLSEMLSMPCSTSHCARSGWSEGPCPQIPTYFPRRLHASIAIFSSAFTASSRSSNVVAMSPPASRSTPSVSCVRSFEPIEKPSKYSRKRSASSAFDGISHIMMTRKPFSPRRSPFLASSAMTRSASPVVRTNGIISSTFVKPSVSRTRRIASHSSSKQS